MAVVGFGRSDFASDAERNGEGETLVGKVETASRQPEPAGNRVEVAAPQVAAFIGPVPAVVFEVGFLEEGHGQRLGGEGWRIASRCLFAAEG